METEETLQTLPKRPPRHCPECGARVAEGAKVCLMCGISLEEIEAPEEEVLVPSKEPRKPRKVIRIAILVIFAIAILAGAGILGWNLSQGNVEVAAELPTFTPTVTSSPTITPSPTQTSTPTLTPTPAPTSTPVPPQSYTVQSGDTLLTIALEFDLTVDQIKAYNGLDSDFLNEGQSLLIPPPTPTPGPTPTLDPDAAPDELAPFILHTVRAGDTLSTIAERYGIRVDDIRTANDIAANSETINVDQVLTIPQYTPTPEAQSETIISGTPTPVLAYAAPDMLYPPDKAIFVGPDDVVILQWASNGILSDKEFYEIEFIAPAAEGKETTKIYQRATAWRVPIDLFPAADANERTFSWRISIVRLVTESGTPNYKVVSQTVRRRTFTWNDAQP